MSQSRNRYSVRNLKYIVVHDGIFHIDDVLTVAIVQLIRLFLGLALLEVIRTSKIKSDWTIENGYLVADVGLGEFDHHFPEADKLKRPNGIAYAAAGLVFAEFWPELGLTEEEYQMIDRSYVEPLDLHDNTFTGNQLALSIKALNVGGNNPEESMKAFQIAVNIMMTFFTAQIQRAKDASKTKEIAEAAVQHIDGITIYLDEYAPIGAYQCVKESKACFIGSPSARGGYQITAIRTDEGSKQLFPEAYRGKPDKSISMTFCHPAGFMACFETKEQAKNFMDWALKRGLLVVINQ